MEMFNPPHPGEIIREDCLKPLKLSAAEAAKGVGVSRQSLFASRLPERDFRRHGATPRIRRLEHGGIVTAQSADLRSLHAKPHAGRLKVPERIK